MVRETPELFERIVKPYIAAFPPKRVQWYNSNMVVLTVVADAVQGVRYLVRKVRGRQNSVQRYIRRLWLCHPTRHEVGPHYHLISIPRRNRPL